MKTNIYAGALALTILLLLMDAAVSAEKEWTHLFTKDGIDVYRKTFPGTPVCAFKGVGCVDATIEVVGSVLQDITAYSQWMARCKESVILKTIDNDTKIFYVVVDVPLPFKDREMIVSNKTVYNLEEGMAEISFDLFDQGGALPPKKYLPVTELSGKYLLEYVGRDKTRVTFVYQGNPGGNIPVSITNWVASRYYPHTIITGLRERVKKRQCVTAVRADSIWNEN